MLAFNNIRHRLARRPVVFVTILASLLSLSACEQSSGDAVCCLDARPERDAAVGIGSSADAGSDVSAQCRGPGYYETGKEGGYAECCAGLHEVFVGKTGYSGNGDQLEPTCDTPPLRVSACVHGTCGDGTCEPEGEGQLCGCVEDCPSAVFTWSDAQKVAQLATIPKSCSKQEIATALLGAASDAKDCGDLALDATPDAQRTAAACARDALANKQPFQLFWRTMGVDSLIHQGVVARVQDAQLRVYMVLVDSTAFSINFSGATASWAPCSPKFSASCDAGLTSCLSCESTSEQITCGCLPKGDRPGLSRGTSVEFRCSKS